MKIKVMFAVLFFLLMAAMPIGFMAKAPKSGDALQESSDEKEIAQTAALCEESFCDEAIRAVAIIQKTNASIEKNGDNSADGNNYNSDSELYKRASKIYNSNKEILLYKNKAVAIPFSSCSNGFTQPDKRYPYLEAVASPWDCFSEKYSEAQLCSGVSVSGIDYLCKKGMSAEDALKWYLPKLSAADDTN